MAQNQFIAGVARALLFNSNTLIGVGKTYTSTAFDFSLSKEEIRGGGVKYSPSC